MKIPEKRRIWLIGATSGIGHQLASDLARQGHQVIISGRNSAILNELHLENPDHFFPLAVDVTLVDELQAAAQQIEETFGGLDTVFYNAGSCIYVDVKQFTHDAFERVFQVNVMGLVYALEAALPLLRRGNNPYIVGMSSSAAFVALPRAEAYGASKAAVQYLMDSLRVDLSAEGIDVSTVFPGFVKTPLTDLNDFPMPFLIDVRQASASILKGMESREHNIHFPKRFTYFLKLLGNLPSVLKTKLVEQTARA